MEKLKSSKGITLVALIITVIILLILTVVAISSITGDGLLEKAKTATNSYEDKKLQEENILGNYADIIDNYLYETITRKKYVFLETGEEAVITSDNKGIIYKDGEIINGPYELEFKTELTGWEIQNPLNIEYSEFLVIYDDDRELFSKIGVFSDYKRKIYVGNLDKEEKIIIITSQYCQLEE